VKLLIDDEYRVRGELAEPFGLLLQDDVKKAAQERSGRPQNVTGTYHRARSEHFRPRSRTNNTPANAGVGSRNDWLVELSGLLSNRRLFQQLERILS